MINFRTPTIFKIIYDMFVYTPKGDEYGLSRIEEGMLITALMKDRFIPAIDAPFLCDWNFYMLRVQRMVDLGYLTADGPIHSDIYTPLYLTDKAQGYLWNYCDDLEGNFRPDVIQYGWELDRQRANPKTFLPA